MNLHNGVSGLINQPISLPSSRTRGAERFGDGPRGRVLVADSDSRRAAYLSRIVLGSGHEVDCASCVGEVEAGMERGADVLLLDPELPGASEPRFYGLLGGSRRDTHCIVIARDADARKVVPDIKRYSAHGCVFPPFDIPTMRAVLRDSIESLETERESRSFLRGEMRFYQQAMGAFDWRSELRARGVRSIVYTLIHQLNINLFHGDGIGALLSSVGMLLSEEKREDDDGMCRVPREILDIIGETYKVSRRACEGFSEAQRILMANSRTEQVDSIRNAHECVRGVVASLSRAAGLKEQKLVLSEAPRGSESMVRWSSESMTRSVRELLINAMKYSDRGRRILIILIHRENHLELKVINPVSADTDIAPPISEEEESLVFEPFYRLSPIIDERYEEEEFGMGLGLTIVRRIAWMHDARVMLQTLPDHLQGGEARCVCVTLRHPIVSDLKNSEVPA